MRTERCDIIISPGVENSKDIECGKPATYRTRQRDVLLCDECALQQEARLYATEGDQTDWFAFARRLRARATRIERERSKKP